jgi:hypothetical protein
MQFYTQLSYYMLLVVYVVELLYFLYFCAVGHFIEVTCLSINMTACLFEVHWSIVADPLNFMVTFYLLTSRCHKYSQPL